VNLLGASLPGVVGARESDQYDAVGLARSTLDERALVGAG